MSQRTYIPGLDEPLPEGERLLWQGRPDTRTLARHAFRIRWIATYFAVLALLAIPLSGGESAGARVVWLVLLGAAALGIITGYAALVARSTVYAVTDRRVVMLAGVAFPAVFNLPLHLVGDAFVRRNRDGSGDVAFQIRGSDRMGYLFLWPHVRPWRIRDPQPMLRGLGEVGPPAAIIREAALDAREEAPPAADRRPVVYSMLDDDGTEILSNRPPVQEPLNA